MLQEINTLGYKSTIRRRLYETRVGGRGPQRGVCAGENHITEFEPQKHIYVTCYGRNWDLGNNRRKNDWVMDFSQMTSGF